MQKMKKHSFLIKTLIAFFLFLSLESTFAQSDCSSPYSITPDEECDSYYLSSKTDEYWIQLTQNEFENIRIFVTSEQTEIHNIILYTGDCKNLIYLDEVGSQNDTLYLYVDSLNLDSNYYLLIQFEDSDIDFEVKMCLWGCDLSITPSIVICTIGDPLVFDFTNAQTGFPFGYIAAWTVPAGIDPNITGTSAQNPTIIQQQVFTAYPQATGNYNFDYYNAGYSESPCQWSEGVIVEPTPIPTFTTDFFNTCHGTPPVTTHYITSTMQDITYTYQIGNGTPQTITTNPFNVDWTGNEDGGVLYINAVNNFRGCPKRDSVKIFCCCEGPDPHFNDATMTAQLQPYEFTVNGTLIIDGDVDFSNTTVHFGPNAKIIINPNKTLDITNSTLLAECDTMWDGIYISSTAQLNIENSVIYQAKNAVVSQDGGDFQISDNTFFKNDYKGVVVETYDDAHPGTITETTFLCDAALLPQYPPVNASRPRCGIEITDVLDYNTYFTIGQASSGMTNSFINLDFGIISYRSKIKVINNSFSDITCNVGVESGIYLEGFDDSNESKAIIGGFNANESNYFEDLCIGVFAVQNMDLDVLANNFESPYYGMVYLAAAQDNILQINGNTIDLPALIGIYASSNPYSTSEILGNEITLSGSGWFGTGIAIEEQIPDNPNAYYEIGGNTVNAPIGYGIYCNNLQGPLISSNVINNVVPAATQRTGISITNCDEAEVTDNSIYYSSSSAYDVNGGIYASLCDDAIFECNHILEAGYGIRCDGYMPSTLKQNYFDDDDKGFWLTNEGEIGAQGDMNTNHYNIWDACDTWDTYTSGNPVTDGALSPFYVRNNAYEKPINNGSLGLSVPIPFTISNNTTNPIACPSSQSMMSGGVTTFVSALCVSIADGSKNFSTPSSEWLAKNAVYQALMKDTSTSLQLSQNNILQNFKDSVAQAAMGQLESVNKQLAQHNLNQAQLQSLFNFNQSITASNAIEENSQAVNAILIDIKLNNKSPDSLQLVFLKDLAWKCPFIDGKSVYQARAMLAYYDDITVIYFNACEYELNNDSKRMPAENEAQEKPAVVPSIKVYPNPASTTLFVEIKADEVNNAVFKLNNMLGQNVLEQALEENSRSFHINIDRFKAGYYSYSLSINNKVVSSDRFIIIK